MILSNAARCNRRQECNRRQQRNDHQIFQQQDRDDALTRLRVELATFFEQLHDDGRGREHESRAGHERRCDGKSRGHADARQQQRTDDHLRQAEPENLAPQSPQTRGLHFQPDDEKEHDHAELGDLQNRLGMREHTQAEGADGHAASEISQHRTQSQTLEQWRRDHRNRQQRDDRERIDAVMFGGHAPYRTRITQPPAAPP